MKRWASGIALAACLVLAAVLLRSRDRLPEEPEDTVSDFFDAQQKGDTGAYLRLTCGDLRNSLERSRDELGSEEFRQSLARSAQGIKGLAIMPTDEVSGESVALDVEIVFADRKECQRMRLTRLRGGWAIASIERSVLEKPVIPYGTPVFEEIEANAGSDAAVGRESHSGEGRERPD